MIHRTLIAAVALTVFAVSAPAEEVKATIKKIDAEKNSVFVTISGDDKTLPVAKDAEIYTQAKGRQNKPGPKQPLTGGLGGLKEGSEVTLFTFKSGEKEIVAAIRV